MLHQRSILGSSIKSRALIRSKSVWIQAGKRSTLEPRSLLIALLDWTIKQKMGVLVLLIPSLSRLLNAKKLTINYFYDILVLTIFVL